jgi:hypothetical protein
MQTIRNTALGLAAAGTLLCSALSAHADGPTILTGAQLDRVTAGAVSVFSSTDAAATGALALVQGTGTSVVSPGTPVNGQPGFEQSSIGASDGVAVAQGTNGVLLNNPPPSSSTSVTTGGTATGNMVIISTFNQTVHGAGGVTAQVGWTVAFGNVIGF